MMSEAMQKNLYNEFNGNSKRLCMIGNAWRVLLLNSTENHKMYPPYKLKQVVSFSEGKVNYELLNKLPSIPWWSTTAHRLGATDKIK